MNTQPPEPWLTVDSAAALTGKSISTIRRLLPVMEKEPGAIKREPIKGRGGERILLSRASLLRRFGMPEPPAAVAMQPENKSAAAVVEILERQLEAKDRQIAALQREGEAKSRQLEEAQRAAADLLEKLGQFAALNASLTQKIALLSERAGAAGEPESKDWEPWLLGAVVLLCAIAIFYLIFG